MMAHSEEETEEFLFFIFTSCFLVTQLVWYWQYLQVIKCIISKKQFKVFQMQGYASKIVL